MSPRPQVPGTSSSGTSLTQRGADRTRPHWLHQSSRLAAVICIAAAALVSPGLSSKASAQAADQPLPIWSFFDDLLAKCFEFIAPPPSPPVGPPPPPGPGPEPIPYYPIIPSPSFPSPLFPTPVVIIPPPPPDTPGPPPGPPPGPVVVPGPVTGAGLPALMLLGALAWFRRRKAHRAAEAGPTSA
jgi:hypothetical protein